MSSSSDLLSHLIDYAGLFPPAQLDMPQVVENYAQYVTGPQRWMLARLIVPAARLDEFEQAAADRLPRDAATPDAAWRLSVLIPPCDAEPDVLQQALHKVQQFNQRHQQASNGLAIIDTLEGKATSTQQIRETLNQFPADCSVFVELPHGEDPRQWITALRETESPASIYAKIRTGGVVASAIPSTEQVARFIDRCAEAQVGLKATAGLHHPLRSEHPLTYQEDAPRGTMHGFLNVFLAMGFAYCHRLDTQQLVLLLEEESVSAFTFQSDRVTWRDLCLSKEEIQQTRDKFGISFGSCSFTEPVEDLKAFGIMVDLVQSA